MRYNKVIYDLSRTVYNSINEAFDFNEVNDNSGTLLQNGLTNTLYTENIKDNNNFLYKTIDDIEIAQDKLDHVIYTKYNIPTPFFSSYCYDPQLAVQQFPQQRVIVMMQTRNNICFQRIFNQFTLSNDFQIYEKQELPDNLSNYINKEFGEFINNNGFHAYRYAIVSKDYGMIIICQLLAYNDQPAYVCPYNLCVLLTGAVNYKNATYKLGNAILDF